MVQLLVAGVFMLCAEGATLTASAFECRLSAIGTVGLTTGITPSLPPILKGVIIALMYAGHVGSLAVFVAVARTSVGNKLKNPVGKIIIG